jgi:hypothetical protein
MGESFGSDSKEGRWKDGRMNQRVKNFGKLLLSGMSRSSFALHAEE